MIVVRLEGKSEHPFVRDKDQRVDNPVVSTDPPDMLLLEELHNLGIVRCELSQVPPLRRPGHVVTSEVENQDHTQKDRRGQATESPRGVQEQTESGRQNRVKR